MLASLAVVAIAAAAIAAFAFYTEASRAGPKAEDVTFTVARGSSAAAIGTQLQQEGLIRNALMFRIGTRVFAPGEALQAGEYAIPANSSVRDIVRLMAEGNALQHRIVFPEGITVRAAMKLIEESEYLTGDMPETPPEGSILPETYHVERGMTRAALVQQMREARDQALAEIWEGRAPGLPFTSPDQLVTLASIVERETGVASERPLVAAVMVNRLRRPMRLEMDSTIIYGVCRQHPDRCADGRLVNRQGQRRPILASEIALNTGYNTYRIDGLPPTPIGNPGRAALEATAHPADSNAIYFVADGSGGHAFAATLPEHNANVARWRMIERERLAAERAPQTSTTQAPQR
ncbi:endolytic transglycosylase MltG [Terricaulis sp.]|uniref:endolytic transglycosylase MltG n=1 Tax=Terricaulis sp. TaxID=2768686 RepID=UPI00378377D3